MCFGVFAFYVNFDTCGHSVFSGSSSIYSCPLLSPQLCCALIQGCPTFFSEGHIQIYVIDGGPLISGVASIASLRGAKVGVIGGGGDKRYGPWKATMELTRGRGPFPTRELDGRQGGSPLENVFDHTL